MRPAFCVTFFWPFTTLIGRWTPAAPIRFHLLIAAALLTASLPANAAEFLHNFTYNTTAYTNKVFVDDSIPSGQLKGVIVATSYGGADAAYTNATWRNFARENSLALCLTLNQDTFGIPANMTASTTVLNNTLTAAATGLGRSELSSSTLPFIFVGISRGGTSGAINFGQAYGANRTIACIAYHGNSFEYITSVSSATAKAIPVLYPIAQLDSGPYRQTDIEAAVRTTGTLSTGWGPYGIRPTNGLFWTTTLQYGSSHASLGDDTYPLQWLGRVFAARYNPATPGTLTGVSTANSSSGSYTLTNGASSTAYFATPATSSFTKKNGNIWLLTAGASEWIAESSQPLAATPYNIDSTYHTIYLAPDSIDNRNFINAGSVTFAGTGTIALDKGVSGNKNYFKMTGGTINIIHGATLKNGALQNADWTNNKASLAIDSTSSFDLSDGAAVQIDALTGAGAIIVGVSTGSRTLTLGNNHGSGTFSGTIAGGATAGNGSIALLKTGNGNQTLSGANTYSGGTTVNAGTLTVSGTGKLGSGDLTIANGALCLITTGNGAIADTAAVSLGTTGKLDLAAGIFERVASLSINGVPAARGVWNSLRDPAHFGGTGNLLVLAPGLTALEDWLQTNLGTTSSTGSSADAADADGDGIPNLIEFATGTLPQTANTLNTTVAWTGSAIEFTYRRSRLAEADGRSFIVEWSDTLANDWSTAGVTQAAVAGTDDGTTQAWKATVPATDIPKRFVRLRIP
ncbi:MAG: hypothetical protein RL376_99 [Verrucomicrobiota bacterium]